MGWSCSEARLERERMLDAQLFGYIVTVFVIPLISPLVISGALLGAARKPRRVVLILAACAIALFLISLALTGFYWLILRPPVPSYVVFVYSNAINYGAIPRAIGLGLTTAAWILGMQRAAQERRRRWFVALLASALLTALVTGVLYAPLYFYLYTPSLLTQPAVVISYTLVGGGLLALTPLPPLLYSLLGRDEPAGS